MSGQGSGGNVIAAVCTFFIPGLGQLVQGRVIPAILFSWSVEFLLSGVPTMNIENTGNYTRSILVEREFIGAI